MRPIELSLRLQALAGQVPRGTRFADIGTDHARLPVWLLEQGVITNAIATDLRVGPLDRARRTAARHRVTERISFRLGDGLQSIQVGEVDVAAIAGMGGEAIVSILAGAPWAASGDCRFLLQPMTSVQDLRRWLWRNGFVIEQELLVREDWLYVILLVRGGTMAPLTPAEEWVGRQQRGMESPLRGEYIEQMLSRTTQALEGLRRASKPEDLDKVAEWERLVRGLEEQKEEWTAWQR